MSLGLPLMFKVATLVSIERYQTSQLIRNVLALISQCIHSIVLSGWQCCTASDGSSYRTRDQEVSRMESRTAAVEWGVRIPHGHRNSCRLIDIH